MTRILIPAGCVMALSLAHGPVYGDPAEKPKADVTVVRLVVTPATPPPIVSRTYVYPEYRDLMPGSRVQALLRCFMEQQATYSHERSEQRRKWLDMPLAELPSDDPNLAWLRGGIAYPDGTNNHLRMIDQAARFDRVEWNEYFELRAEGPFMLLPEVQQLRALVRVVALRMRLEVKAGEFDRAIASAKTLFGIADALGRHPTMIGCLVAIAIVNSTLDGLELMVGRPGCPNMYWALTDVPAPVVPLRKAASGERVLVFSQLGPFISDTLKPMTNAELAAALRKLSKLLKGMDGKVQAGWEIPGTSKLFGIPHSSWVYSRWAADADRVVAARGRLVSLGVDANRLRELPPIQVIVLDDVRQFEAQQDAALRWLVLPYWQAAPAIDRVEKQADELTKTHLVAGLDVKFAKVVKLAQARADQRIAALRIVEAVRDYAHGHDGRVPPDLDAISLPLPVDPVSGEPFVYTIADGTAHLRGALLVDELRDTSRTYEISVRESPGDVPPRP